MMRFVTLTDCTNVKFSVNPEKVAYIAPADVMSGHPIGCCVVMFQSGNSVVCKGTMKDIVDTLKSGNFVQMGGA